jgi:hypothetical protein
MVYDAGMVEQTAEQKLARYETVLDLQMKELSIGCGLKTSACGLWLALMVC